MIRPNHECYWSHSRSTSVNWKDGCVTFAGTSLPVIMDAFQGEPLQWFSLEYGDIHNGQYENLVLVGVDPDARKELQPYPEAGPLTAALNGNFVGAEYPLDQAARIRLGVLEEETGFDLVPTSVARYRIHLHDDCFASVEPAVSDDLVRRLLQGVLRLHSYYLGAEVEWGEVPDHLLELLRDNGKWDLVSDVEKQVVTVEPGDQAAKRRIGWPFRRVLGMARIQQGGADWQSK